MIRMINFRIIFTCCYGFFLASSALLMHRMKCGRPLQRWMVNLSNEHYSKRYEHILQSFVPNCQLLPIRHHSKTHSENTIALLLLSAVLILYASFPLISTIYIISPSLFALTPFFMLFLSMHECLRVYSIIEMMAHGEDQTYFFPPFSWSSYWFSKVNVKIRNLVIFSLCYYANTNGHSNFLIYLPSLLLTADCSWVRTQYLISSFNIFLFQLELP